MSKMIDISGQKFGTYTAKKVVKSLDKYTRWLFVCECGHEKIQRFEHIKRNKIIACPECRKRIRFETKGKFCKTKTKLYIVWASMKQRIFDVNNNEYKNYGGRGISICKEWLESFEAFESWAKNNGYEKGLTIERIDCNGNYSAENCTWATQKQQANNRRTNRFLEYNGQRKTLAQWEDVTGIKQVTIRARIESGWSIESALTTPTRQGKYNTYKTKRR